MKTLYFECKMGAAGDMLMAALWELQDNKEEFLKKINSIGIPNVSVMSESKIKCGIKGTKVVVKVNGHEEHEHDIRHNHQHNELHDIEHIINDLKVTEIVKKNAIQVYKIIAESESVVHGVPVSQVHFHEVGDLDAITDIVGVCMLIEAISPDVIISSPINVGSGYVKCVHGILPVPAPATANILKKIPFYNDEITSELCTPTGAALLKHFVSSFSTIPIMTNSKIGYGMGSKDFEKVNCVRAFLGETENSSDQVIEIVCNLDDMTGEDVAFAQQKILEQGALDVYSTPILMKKGRQGISFTCMCKAEDKEKMLALIFKHTTTIGVREYRCQRYVMQREFSEIQTEFGSVRVKKSTGFGVTKKKIEHEDVAKIAHETDKSLRDIHLSASVNKSG